MHWVASLRAGEKPKRQHKKLMEENPKVVALLRKRERDSAGLGKSAGIKKYCRGRNMMKRPMEKKVPRGVLTARGPTCKGKKLA